MRSLVALLAVAAFPVPSPGAQPSVDELVAHHIEALGGSANLKAVQTVRMTGTAVLGGQMNSPLTLLLKRPASSRLELEYQGQAIVQGYDGSTAWMLIPMRQPPVEKATPEETMEIRESSDLDGALVDYKAKGYKVENLGSGDAGGKRAWMLKVTRSNGHVETIYLDEASYLPLKISIQRAPGGKAVEIERFPSDYRKAGGIMLPYTIEQKAEGKTVMLMKIEKIELNVPLDEALFQMPAKNP